LAKAKVPTWSMKERIKGKGSIRGATTKRHLITDLGKNQYSVTGSPIYWIRILKEV